MDVAKFVVLAALIEALWETVTHVYSDGKIQWKNLGVLALGMIVTALAQLDLFALVGIPLAIPYVGSVLTGVLLSRGANFVHDFLETIKGVKSAVKLKAEEEENAIEESEASKESVK